MRLKTLAILPLFVALSACASTPTIPKTYVTPIKLGGTDAKTADQALLNLGAVKTPVANYAKMPFALNTGIVASYTHLAHLSVIVNVNVDSGQSSVLSGQLDCNDGNGFVDVTHDVDSPSTHSVYDVTVQLFVPMGCTYRIASAGNAIHTVVSAQELIL